MTNMKRRAAAVLLLAAVGGWNGVAWANHFTGACASELNAVETAIQNGVFLGKSASTDQTNLLAKLEAAAAKVGLKKYDDAVDKLQDISDKATALASAPKSKLEDASGINGAVITAIACVGGL
ncbi:MAG TPA: hypothetical protein VFZ84_22420 [Burkholderiales bacterium]